MRKFFATIGCISLLFSILGERVIPQAHAQERFTVSIKASKKIVEPKQTFVYTITIKNVGSSTAEDQELYLTIDDSLDFQKASNSGREQGDGIIWKDITLAPGQSRTFNASVQVESRGVSDGDRLYATAFIGNGFDEVTVNVEDEDDENNDDERAITVNLYSNKGQVEPTETFSFIVEINNYGKRRVTNVEVSVELAENLEFLSAANRGKKSGDKIVWKNIDIDGEETRTLTASVRATDDAEHGENLTSIAYAEGSVYEHTIKVFDPNHGREHVQLNLFAEEDEVIAGGKLGYTIRVKNLTNHKERIDVSVSMDPRASLASASDNGMQFTDTLIKWEDVAFNQSETKSFSLKVNVPDDVEPGSILRLSAQAGMDQKQVAVRIAAPVQTESSIPLFSTTSGFLDQAQEPQVSTVPPSIIVTKQADKDEVQPGSMITYSIAVQNTGSQPVHNLHIVDAFPQGSLNVRDAGGGNATDSSVEWTIPVLAANDTWSTKYRARTSSSLDHGMIINTKTQALSNHQLIASAIIGTNVIDQLPQAGWGTYAVAFNEAQKHLRSPIKTHVAKQIEAVAAIPKKSSNGFPLPMWMLVIVGGIGVGMIAGNKLKASGF